MAKLERVREVLQGPLILDDLVERAAAGWKPIVIEWERETTSAEQPKSERRTEEVPYGLQVAADCFHLEDNPHELETLKFLTELIVQDITLSRMAEDLNRRGFLTREGKSWSAVAVFGILPRVIDVAPRILSSEEWSARRKQLTHVTWNS